MITSLNSELAKLTEWFKANKLSINVYKTHYRVFHRSRRKLDKGDILLDIGTTTIIKWTNKRSRDEKNNHIYNIMYCLRQSWNHIYLIHIINKTYNAMIYVRFSMRTLILCLDHERYNYESGEVTSKLYVSPCVMLF